MVVAGAVAAISLIASMCGGLGPIYGLDFNYFTFMVSAIIAGVCYRILQGLWQRRHTTDDEET